MQWGLFQQVQDEQQKVHEQAAHQSGDHPSRGGGGDGWLGHLGRNGGGRGGGSSRLREHRCIKARASKFWRQALHDQFQINEQVVADDLLTGERKTHHEALPVEKGVKYAANLWMHLYDFKTPSRAGLCPFLGQNTHGGT